MFAIQPTRGFVSTKHILGVTKSFDSINGIAKSVLDLANLMESLLEPIERHGLPPGGYESSMTKSWSGMRVGYSQIIQRCGRPRHHHLDVHLELFDRIVCSRLPSSNHPDKHQCDTVDLALESVYLYGGWVEGCVIIPPILDDIIRILGEYHFHFSQLCLQ